MASVINQIKFNDIEYAIAASAYAECSTAADTAAKIATICTDGDTTHIDFSLIKGVSIKVKFINQNTASDPTLNVNSTGAKAIKYRGKAISSIPLASNQIYEFVYDGINWDLITEIDIKTPEYSVSANDANTHYYKLFTIQPSKTGYGDLHYSFEINDRSNQFTKVYVYTQSINDNKYFGTTTIRYEGELGSNITAYRFKDTTNKVERLEIWGTISSWNTWKIIP